MKDMSQLRTGISIARPKYRIRGSGRRFRLFHQLRNVLEESASRIYRSTAHISILGKNTNLPIWQSPFVNETNVDLYEYREYERWISLVELIEPNMFYSLRV